ncbi:unnamed protein product [Aureobasidium vineae]|uniref:Uncharacterized protein n=1 Tax=Aureobasidium vineae TaxID=2773715 RepID=A0A9N8J9I3_9PEZI|nr:unnamed protein product [Aureobasidium vineae]
MSGQEPCHRQASVKVEEIGQIANGPAHWSESPAIVSGSVAQRGEVDSGDQRVVPEPRSIFEQFDRYIQECRV